MIKWKSLWLVGALLPSAALAGTVSEPVPAKPLPAEARLTPAEIEQVLDAAAKRRETVSQPEEAKPGIPVHGEVGFAIGTGGYRSAFGNVYVPLSDDGFAAFSFDTTDFNFRDHRRR